ncbi:MAG: outer membrane beta-barrel protein [Bacteroidales bacterium]|nr:outer membrane beta-barrel protein [Bacteroidales bacterium]
MKVKSGKMIRMVVLACVSMAFLFPFSAQAQRQDFLSRSELLLMGGGMNYIGDLNNQSALTIPRLAAGVGLRYRIDNRWALRGEVSYGSVACEEDYNKLRNLSFKSDIWELSALAEFNFAPFGPGATERLWTPYIFGGLGVFHFNPMAKYTLGDGEEMWAELQPLRTEGQGSSEYSDRKLYPLTQICVPFGVGIKCRLGKAFSLAAEYGFRMTWTDYLDDVSKTYVGSALIMQNSDDGALAAQLADRSGEVVEGYVNAVGIKRGDDALNDWYAYFHVSVGISFEVLLGWMRSKRCRK